MNAQATSSSLPAKKVLPVNWLKRSGYFVLFLACGLLVFIVFSHYFPMLTRPADTIGRIALGGAFLAAALFARRSERFKQYWLLLFAFFAALTAISIDRYLSLSKWILPALGVKPESPEGWAIEKLESSLLGIVIVLLLNRLFALGLDRERRKFGRRFAE